MDRVGEVLKRAPLAVVSAEIQYHYSATLNTHARLESVATALRPVLPVANFEQRESLERETEQHEIGEPKFLELTLASRDHKVYATIGPFSMVLALAGSAYQHFNESFMPVLKKITECLLATDSDLSVHRLGMRYIDELRKPDDTQDLSIWQDWVTPSLLAANDLFPNNDAENIRGSIAFPSGENERLLLNWGTFRGSTIVSPDLPFADHDIAPSRIFVLDADATWTSPENGESMSAQTITDTFHRLHSPCSHTFMRCLTPQAIDYFRGE